MSKQQFEVIRLNGVLPDPKSISSDKIIGDLWPAYVDSLGSLLNKLEAAAMRLEAGENIEEDAASIRRLIHSIKGESGMCGVMDVYDLCHQAEFGFEQLPMEGRADMVLKVKDWIELAVKNVQNVGIESPKEVSPKTSQAKIKTLIVEDDYICRKAVKRMLDDYCDFVSAADGIKALELFKEATESGEPYGLMTLDVQMPKMDGYETLEAIRQYEKEMSIDESAAVKVIIITSLTEHNFGPLRTGFEAYLVKPVGIEIYEALSELGLIKEQSQLVK